MKFKHLLIIMIIPLMTTVSKAQTILGEDFDIQLFLKWNSTTAKWDSSKLYEYILHDTASVSGKWKYVITEKDFNNGVFELKSKARYNIAVTPPIVGFDSIASYTWDPISSTYNTWFRLEVSYNSKGKPLNMKTYMKNPVFPGQPNEFLYGKTLYYFDGTGNQKGSITFTYSITTSKLERSDSSVYTVDANNNITNEIQLQYKTGVWVNNKQISKTFNAKNAEILAINQKYLNNVWENQDKTTTTYDANDKQIERETFGWVTNAWVAQRKTVTAYNGTQKSSDLVTTWSTGTNTYVNSNRTNFYFSIAGKRDSTLEESWNTSLNVWEKSGKYLFKYGSIVANTPTPPSNLQLVPMKVELTGKMKLTWTDNSNNELAFVIQRSTNNVNFVNIDSTAANVITYTDLGLTANTVYYYRVYAYNANGSSLPSNTANATTVGINESASFEQMISLYPNPCSNHFVIESNSIQGNEPIEIMVYNLLGKMVQTELVSPNTRSEISTQNLASGIYFIKLKIANNVVTRKLTIE